MSAIAGSWGGCYGGNKQKCGEQFFADITAANPNLKKHLSVKSADQLATKMMDTLNSIVTGGANPDIAAAKAAHAKLGLSKADLKAAQGGFEKWAGANGLSGDLGAAWAEIVDKIGC